MNTTGRVTKPLLVIFLAGVVFGSCRVSYRFTHGIQIGELREHQAIIWARLNRPGFLHATILSCQPRPCPEMEERIYTGKVESNSDSTAQVELTGLEKATRYVVRLWVAGEKQLEFSGGNSITTKFTTPGQDKVYFGFSGDIGGQNVCRHDKEGYAIFELAAREKFDFFIGLGDLIYADDICTSVGRFGFKQVSSRIKRARTYREFVGKWLYNRSDRHYQSLLLHTPFYPVWDDHEVLNNFGPAIEKKYPGYVWAGLNAFISHHAFTPAKKKTNRLYDRYDWGKNVSLFFLDNRSFRDANSASDGPNKTMLGQVQLEWLLAEVKKSKAVWKIIVSSVPISVPTGSPSIKEGRDGWANYGWPSGYEAELGKILSALAKAKVKNLIFLTTDVHMAAAYRYQPFDDDFMFHEFMTGPVSANFYRNDRMDDTFKPERLFIYGPKKRVTDYQTAKLFFNYGRIKVKPKGQLEFEVIDGEGTRVYQLELKPK